MIYWLIGYYRFLDEAEQIHSYFSREINIDSYPCTHFYLILNLLQLVCLTNKAEHFYARFFFRAGVLPYKGMKVLTLWNSDSALVGDHPPPSSS